MVAVAKLEVPFANQLGESAVAQNSRERLINMFAEKEISGRRILIRRQRVCLSLAQALTGEKRCIEKNDGIHYLVVANKFYTYSGGTLTERGTLDTSTGFCTMVFDENGEVAISDGVKIYHWTGASFTEPATQSVVGTLTFLGGFAVYNEPDTGRFWWSGVNDMTAWAALDFATGEGKPDNLVRVFDSYKQLWLFGEETTEIWALTGGADSPFTPYTVMERGCGAGLSVVREDNSLFWLGNDWVVYRADGYRPMRVSTHPIERLIEDVPLASRQLCRGFSYSDQGHKFVTLVFPDYLTVQYNVATQLWNVAKTYEQDDWEAMGSQFTDADYVLGNAGISTLSRGLNKDNGVAVERGGISSPISEGSSRVVINSLFLDCEVGMASASAEITLRVARDGVTFGAERVRNLGAAGDYNHRAVWRNLGTGRRMTVEAMVTGDFEFSILGADIEGEILNG